MGNTAVLMDHGGNVYNSVEGALLRQNFLFTSKLVGESAVFLY